jgi:hypothetical protein
MKNENEKKNYFRLVRQEIRNEKKKARDEKLKMWKCWNIFILFLSTKN